MAAGINALLKRAVDLTFAAVGDTVLPLTFYTLRPLVSGDFNATTGAVNGTAKGSPIALTALASPVQSFLQDGHQVRQRKFLVRSTEFGATVPQDKDWVTEADSTRWDIYAVERLGDTAFVLRGSR